MIFCSGDIKAKFFKKWQFITCNITKHMVIYSCQLEIERKGTTMKSIITMSTESGNQSFEIENGDIFSLMFCKGNEYAAVTYFESEEERSAYVESHILANHVVSDGIEGYDYMDVDGEHIYVTDHCDYVDLDEMDECEADWFVATAMVRY